MTDSRWQVRTADLLEDLTAEQRSQLNEANELEQSSVIAWQQGQYFEALESAIESLDIRQELLGEEHPDTALSLNNLGALYDSMGDYSRGELLYQQALEIDRKVLGEEHPDTARSLNNLGMLYKSMGDSARAEQFYQQALDILRRVLGDAHPDTASTRGA